MCRKSLAASIYTSTLLHEEKQEHEGIPHMFYTLMIRAIWGGGGA